MDWQCSCSCSRVGEAAALESMGWLPLKAPTWYGSFLLLEAGLPWPSTVTNSLVPMACAMFVTDPSCLRGMKRPKPVPFKSRGREEGEGAAGDRDFNSTISFLRRRPSRESFDSMSFLELMFECSQLVNLHSTPDTAAGDTRRTTLNMMTRPDSCRVETVKGHDRNPRVHGGMQLHRFMNIISR